MDYNGESQHKISYDVYRGFRNYRDNSNSFCREGTARNRDADTKIHENTEPEEGELVSQQDLAFHIGTCQGGISTDALENLLPNGCDDLPSPGQSGD